MVTRLFLAAAASSLLLAYSAPRSAAKSLGVATLVVEKEAQWVAGSPADDTPEQCARFKLSREAALQYFRTARQVSSQRWVELNYANCSASGTLITTDHRQGNWTIQEFGVGHVKFADGKEAYLSGRGFGRWK
jgi:hypothetical protein